MRKSAFAAAMAASLLLCSRLGHAETTEQLIVRADQAYAASRWADALPLYREAASSQAPDTLRARAQSRIGYVLYKTGDRAGAGTAWAEAAKRFPDQPKIACDSLVRVGNLAVAAGDYPGAIRSFGDAVEKYGAAPEAKDIVPEALVRLGAAYLHQAEAAKGAAPSGATAQAAWDAAEKDFKLARASLERVVKDFPTAAEHAAEARLQLIALDFEWALYDRGGTHDAVVAGADRFLRDFPSDTARIPTVRLLRGEALEQLGRYDDAIAELNAVMALPAAKGKEPAGTAQFHLARCYDRKGDGERAIEEYRRFLRDVKPSFTAWQERPGAAFFIGYVYERMRRPDEATAAYEAVESSYPGSLFATLARRQREYLESRR